MIITVILYYSLFLIILMIGVVRYKKLTTPYKILLLNVAITLIGEVVSKYCAIKYKNNMPIAHISVYTDFFLNGLIFYYLFKSKLFKRMILIGMGLIILFFIFNSLKLQPYNNVFPSNALLVSEIIYVTLSLLIFKQMLQYPLQINITRQSIFWFNTAILFFSTTAFLNYGLINYVVKHHLDYLIAYYCGFVTNMIFYTLIGMSILIDDKNIAANNA